jgi:hypothetical protein
MTLDATIALHRDLYRADLNIPRLVSRQPPTTFDPHSGELHEEPATRTGMSMSGPLLRYLGHPEGYGELYPWARALWELRHWCRREHRFHRDASRPYWRGSLCHSLVRLTVIGADKGNYGPLSIEEAGKVLRYDNPEPVLRLALEHIEETIDKRQRDAIAREAMLEKHVRPVNDPEPELATPHHLGPFHEADCVRCAKENAA